MHEQILMEKKGENKTVSSTVVAPTKKKIKKKNEVLQEYSIAISGNEWVERWTNEQ